MLEEYLRHFVSASQKDWVKLLDVAQFCYNMQKSEASGHSPFELATGQQPLAPHTVASGYRGKSPAAYHFAKDWQEQTDLAKAYLEKAAKRMKKWADPKRRPVEYKEGDLVMMKVRRIQGLVLPRTADHQVRTLWNSLQMTDLGRFNTKDRVVWLSTPSGRFSIKAATKDLIQNDEHFPWSKIIWDDKGLPKHN